MATHTSRGEHVRPAAHGGPPGVRLVALSVAAQMFGVSVKTLRRRIADGTVRGYRVGRLVRVDLDEVREALVAVIPSAR
ncbi:helix-turn-helix domain-containing protein [Antribacter sp. KLBMP9083]|uniref:Helix-turn-helix domain-containing protein n=1 Tax=Antribacter soli TaxID=2910976 RepID=A0AA41QEN0_9MICO|nr:helix-turn-helix domain-containing protein [Antribacter soli]MCF4121736.1 helix-turn-helix domain-containing protein [Antribacter soli]